MTVNAERPGQILLTPGPLTTRDETRRAMMRDWGSRDQAFIALTAELRRRLLEIADGSKNHVCIPLQGSGTFIVEAVIGSLVPLTGRLLVLINGAYGERILTIAGRLGRSVTALRWPEDHAIQPEQVEQALLADPSISHVALVHCETTTGLLNPLEETAAVVARSGKALLVDAMSSFGALPLNLEQTPIAAVAASSNKCLEGTPGLGFALVDKVALCASQGTNASLSFDLYEQWRGFEANGQWRFTPPVQIVAALVEALRQLDAEGGRAARLRRYQDNFDCLANGMRNLGFELLLDPAIQAPIIATFRQPQAEWFRFQSFYDALAQRGFLIYPGKLSHAETFRIGCIGALQRDDFVRLLTTIGEIRDELSVAGATCDAQGINLTRNSK